MSRYDQPSEPDLDQYETRPDDIDVPDFDAPEPPVDPAEHDVQMAMTAAHRLQEAILATTTLERAHVLKGLTRQFHVLADLIDRQASAKIDEILERRR